MKRVCKQCGKTFELSNSEIAFYKSKNLNLPKRCKACRQANRQEKSVREKDGKVQEQAQEQTSAQVRVQDVLDRQDHKAGRWVYALIAAAALLLLAITGISNRDRLSDGAVPLSAVEESERPDGEKQYTFRDSRLLDEHFEKHGKEMGFSSAEEYQAAAGAVVNHADALHKTEKEDGDDVYYLEATNEFVIVSTDGFIRTYFYPDEGIDYYNRQ
ncbi:MAG: zinc-ribbon domain containing protein [Blautia sp.]|nr:zinc-ribbon domain containing protein [Blautia sp.]MCM1201866.1 zinc-ribbon domain containing protein [Bacteroides fragilis]